MKIVTKLIYKGEETTYTISDTGEVFNKKNKKMKLRITPNGYVQLCLRINKTYFYVYAHRAVYESFIGPIPTGLEINHIDGNKLNNSLSNLEAITPKENKRHAWDTGLAYHHNPHERYHVQKKLEKDIPLDMVEEICKALESPDSTYLEIAEKFKIEPWIIYHIMNGNLWLDISSKYKLKQRFKKRAKKYKERDEIIFKLRSKGYTIQQIADELGISFDATARRIYPMRKDGYEI
jgi:hypothetical protein